MPKEIRSWWSEDRKWFCIYVDDGASKATISLTPEEAANFFQATPVSPVAQSELSEPSEKIIRREREEWDDRLTTSQSPEKIESERVS